MIYASLASNRPFYTNENIHSEIRDTLELSHIRGKTGTFHKIQRVRSQKDGF